MTITVLDGIDQHAGPPRSRGIAQQPRKTGIAPASRAPVLGTVGVSLLMTRHYQFHSGFGRTVSGLAWGVAPTAPPGRSGPRRLRPSLPDMGKSRRACRSSGHGDKCYWQAIYLLIWDKQALFRASLTDQQVQLLNVWTRGR